MREPTEENRLGEAADVRNNQCVIQEEAQGGVSVSDPNETNKALRTINAETFNPKFSFFIILRNKQSQISSCFLCYLRNIVFAI